MDRKYPNNYVERHEADKMNQTHYEEFLTWNDFIQRTTFHGVKFIFDKTPYFLRRYVERFMVLRYRNIR